MSYTMTIDAPSEVVSYLERGSATRNAELARRFVEYLVAQYNALRAQETAVTPVESARIKLSPRVRALCGCVKIPAEFENRPYKDIVADEMTARYLERV